MPTAKEFVMAVSYTAIGLNIIHEILKKMICLDPRREYQLWWLWNKWENET